MICLASMTGFARKAGSDATGSWFWELRSVNGRGLDVRFRLPPGLDQLEPLLRKAAGAHLARGSVQAGLQLREEAAASLVVDRPLLARLANEAQQAAEAVGGAPAPRMELLMALPGVVRREAVEDSPLTEARLGQITADFVAALANLADNRRAEGERLVEVVSGLIAQLSACHDAAANEAKAQPLAMQRRMAQALDALLQGKTQVSEDRLAQEVALLAIRADVTEEIDRLGSHLAAAGQLLNGAGPAGRQLDFLTQELVREINTLCSKSATTVMTGIGLQMKGIVEQIREQVQNIE